MQALPTTSPSPSSRAGYGCDRTLDKMKITDEVSDEIPGLIRKRCTRAREEFRASSDRALIKDEVSGSRPRVHHLCSVGYWALSKKFNHNPTHTYLTSPYRRRTDSQHSKIRSESPDIS